MNEGFRFSAFPASDEGRVRDHNEDSFSVTRVRNEYGEYHLWVVADGMGGGPRGEVASKLAIETLVTSLSTSDWQDPADALRDGFADANRAVHAEGVAGGAQPRTMGTTMVAILIHEATGRAWVANVGDSRLYLVTARDIWQVTRDHSLVAERQAAGLITEAQAKASGERNVITRAIGIDESVATDVFDLPDPLGPNERVLLCSDGLHGMIDDSRIGDLVGAGPAELATRALIAAANQAGGLDNITAIVGGDHAVQKMPSGWRRVKPQRSSNALPILAAAKGPATAGVPLAPRESMPNRRMRIVTAVALAVLLAVVAGATWWTRRGDDPKAEQAAALATATSPAIEATPASPPAVVQTALIPTPTPQPPTATPTAAASVPPTAVTPASPLADREAKGCWTNKPAAAFWPISTLASNCAALVGIKFKDLVSDNSYVRFCDKLEELNPGVVRHSGSAVCLADYAKPIQAPSDDWILNQWKRP